MPLPVAWWQADAVGGVDLLALGLELVERPLLVRVLRAARRRRPRRRRPATCAAGSARHLRLLLLHPRGVLVGRLRDDHDRHVAVLLAADLAALAAVGAGLVDREPRVLHEARDAVLVDAELRHVPAVDHVVRGDEQAHLLADRHHHRAGRPRAGSSRSSARPCPRTRRSGRAAWTGWRVKLHAVLLVVVLPAPLVGRDLDRRCRGWRRPSSRAPSWWPGRPCRPGRRSGTTVQMISIGGVLVELRGLGAHGAAVLEDRPEHRAEHDRRRCTTQTHRIAEVQVVDLAARWAWPAAGCRRGSRRARGERQQAAAASAARARRCFKNMARPLLYEFSQFAVTGIRPRSSLRQLAPPLVRQQPPQRHRAARVGEAQRATRPALPHYHPRPRPVRDEARDARASRASTRTSCSPISSRSKSASCAASTRNASATRATSRPANGITGHAPIAGAPAADAQRRGRDRPENPTPRRGAQRTVGHREVHVTAGSSRIREPSEGRSKPRHFSRPRSRAKRCVRQLRSSRIRRRPRRAWPGSR